MNKVPFLLKHSSRICRCYSCDNVDSAETKFVAVDEVHRFCCNCMTAVGTPETNARQLANILVEADKRGHYSHGLNRLEMYIQDISTGTCDPKATPEILKETVATAYVDGKNGLGVTIGEFCMDKAISKANNVGIGLVVTKGSNHFGIASWYSMMALKHGFLAILGTNPISLAAPSSDRQNFILDMATSAAALGKVEVNRRKGLSIPVGWATNAQGEMTTNPNDVESLMPLGGPENMSGYKGYGLAMLVEIFCGSAYGPNIRKWMTNSQPANLGQCFISVNPDCFNQSFTTHLSDLLNTCRNCQPVTADKPVLVAGDPEDFHIRLVHNNGGISYHINQIKACVSKVSNKNL